MDWGSDEHQYRRVKRRDNPCLPIKCLEGGFDSQQYRELYGNDGDNDADGIMQATKAIMFLPAVQVSKHTHYPFCLSSTTHRLGTPDEIKGVNHIEADSCRPLWMELRFQFQINRDYMKQHSAWDDARLHTSCAYRLIVFQWKPRFQYFRDYEHEASISALPEDLLFMPAEGASLYTFGALERDVTSFFNHAYKNVMEIVYDEYFCFDIPQNDSKVTNTYEEVHVIPDPPGGAVGTEQAYFPGSHQTVAQGHNGINVRRIDLTHLQPIINSPLEWTTYEPITHHQQSVATPLYHCWHYRINMQNGIYMLCLKDRTSAFFDLNLRSRISVSDE